MAEYKSIIVVQANEAGQPTNLLALGDNDNISDEVLSDAVRDAAVAVPGLKQATGTLNNQVTSLNTATGTLKAEIDAIEGTSVTAIENDVTALFAATGSNFHDITGIKDATASIAGDVTALNQATGLNFHDITGINDATASIAGDVTALNQATGLNFHDITGIKDATASIAGDVTALNQATGLNFHDITGVKDATASLQSQVDAIDGVANPLTEDLDLTGFKILNVERIDGDPNESTLPFAHHNAFVLQAGGDGTSTAATGTVYAIASDLILRERNIGNPAGLNINVGKGLLVTDTSAVPVSGHDGTTVDDPPNGAALILDTAEGLFKYKKIRGINIADGSITGANLANSTVSGNQLAAGAATDNIQINSLNYNMLPLQPTGTILGRRGSGFNGPTEQLTASQVRDIVNNGNQEITGNVGINTAATPTAPLQIEDTGTDDAVYIESSDTGSDAGPVITLKRDSASPAGADYLGQLKFKGESSTGAERVYAKITAKIDDPTNGSEDGALEIMNRFNGSNQIAVRLKEDSFRLLNSVELHVDGNTGLGTNNPSEKLDVQGNIAVTGTVDGRDIAADGTKLDGIEGAFAVGTTAPSSPDEGDLWYDTTTGVDELFAYDSARGKWLSTCTRQYYFARDAAATTSHAHLGPGALTYNAGSRIGYFIPYDMTMVGYAWSQGSAATDTTDWTHRIQRYNLTASANSTILDISPTGTYGRYKDMSLNTDFDADGLLGSNMVAGGSSTAIQHQTVTIFMKRRTS